jgi:PIN domain nuclease of toxin-antitoxin system
VILDASALLALIFNEPGASLVAGHLPHASISAVNYTEVLTRLVREGETPEQAVQDLADLDLPVLAWDRQSAEAAASLSPLAKSHGLSLGDRACLATGRLLHRPVITAERKWRDLPVLAIKIRFIR